MWPLLEADDGGKGAPAPDDRSLLPPAPHQGPPARTYPFPLDPFQQTAINCLEAEAERIVICIINYRYGGESMLHPRDHPVRTLLDCLHGTDALDRVCKEIIVPTAKNNHKPWRARLASLALAHLLHKESLVSEETLSEKERDDLVDARIYDGEITVALGAFGIMLDCVDPRVMMKGKRDVAKRFLTFIPRSQKPLRCAHVIDALRRIDAREFILPHVKLLLNILRQEHRCVVI